MLNLKLCRTVLQCCWEDCSPRGPAPGPTTSSSSHSTWCEGIIMSSGIYHNSDSRSHFYPRWTWHHRHLLFSKLSWYVFWCKTRTLSPNVHFTQHNKAMDDADVIISCDDALRMTLSDDSMWWLMTGHEQGWPLEHPRPPPPPAHGRAPLRARPRPGQQRQGPASDEASNTPPSQTLYHPEHRFHKTMDTLRKLQILYCKKYNQKRKHV